MALLEREPRLLTSIQGVDLQRMLEGLDLELRVRHCCFSMYVCCDGKAGAGGGTCMRLWLAVIEVQRCNTLHEQ